MIDVPASIFRAYDIRGVVDDTLTSQVVYALGRAIGSEAYERGQQKLILGRDGRLSAPALAKALSEGLRATGRNVTDIGQVPTPLLYFATHYLGAESGVMVTGSHNPPEYNGLKIVLGGETLFGEAIQGLRRRIETGRLLNKEGGGYQTVDVVGDYIEHIVNDVTLQRPMSVVVDCGNGVAGAVAPRLLEALGCQVSKLFCDVDGHFPNHHPDPSIPENLEAMVNLVRLQGVDLGIAFDGDGDRLGVVDSQGNIIWPDRLLMLFSMDILSRHPGADIIYDVKCTNQLAEVIQAHAGRPLMWKTGHSLIKAKMKETGALLAGEMSGHIFIKERWFGFDDALYACTRLLEILSADPRPTRQIFASLPNSISTPELRVDVAEGQQFDFVQDLIESASFEGAQLSTIDGLRADFEDGWGLVRASNTTPSLVMRFDARDEQSLKRIQGEFRRQMLSVDPNLSLPF
jgi:Phosphomannomutase